jgi:tetratricopeptide (TPR) repeat protein
VIENLDNETLNLFDRLALGSNADRDMQSLRLAAIASGSDGQFQFGKFIVNLGSGKDVHIGDKIILGASAENVRKAVESIQVELARNSFQVSLREYFRAIRMYAREFPYLSVNFPLGKSLADVYVPIDVISDSNDPNPQRSEGQERDIRTALEDSMTGSTRCTLLLGPAGAGKSTILRQILEHAWDRPEEIGLKEAHLAILVRFQFLVKATGGSLEERLWAACRESNEYVLSSPPPPSWFTEWPRITGRRWLLLLDGLDEVPDARKAEIESWLRQVQESGYVTVVTSRNIPAISSSKFLRSRFTWYRVKPLTISQQRSLARNWLGSESDQFFHELKRFKTAELLETPLLLTIAAVVFHSDKKLPGRRSSLYRRFVDVWLAEAARRGLSEDLGDISQYVREGLRHLAFLMSTQHGCRTEAVLKNELSQFFTSALGRKPLEAGKLADKFIEASARRIGLFTLSRHGECSWLHATFHEFLTAEAVSKGSEPWEFVGRWREDHWRSVVMFLFDIWSEERDVSSEVLSILKEGRLDASLFASELIAQGVAVTEALARETTRSLCDWLVAELRTQASLINDPKGLGQLVLGSQGNIRLLASIQKLHAVGPSIRSFAETLVKMCRDHNSPNAEMQALEQLGREQELVELLEDSSLNSAKRSLALDSLIRLEEWEALRPFLVSFFGEASGEEAKTVLDKLREGLPLEAIHEYVATANFSNMIRSYAAKLFVRRADASEISRLANDDTLPKEVRLPAVLALRRTAKSSGDQPTKVPELTHADGLPEVDFLNGLVDSLINLEEWDELTEVAVSKGTPEEIQVRVMYALVSAKRADDLEKLLDSLKIDARIFAARKTYELRPDDKSAALLLKAYEEALIINPQDLGTRRVRADLLRNLNRDQESIREYGLVLDAGLDDMALCHRALAYRKVKKFDEALADLTLSLTISEDDWTYLERGRTHWLVGHYENAIEDFQKAVGLETPKTWFFKLLGDCYRQTFRFAEATEWLNRAVESDATDSTSLEYRGKAHLDSGQLEESLKDLTQAIELNPESQLCRTLRGECNRKLGRYHEALIDFKVALNMGESGRAISQAISVCMMLQLHEEAEKYLAVALATSTEEPWFNYLQALLILLRGGPGSDRLLKSAIDSSRNAIKDGRDLDRLESNIAIYSLAMGDRDTAKRAYEHLLKDRRGRFRIQRFALTEISELASLTPKNSAAQFILHWLRQEASALADTCAKKDGGTAIRELTPVYCSLNKITSMEAEYDICSRILKSQDFLGPTIVLVSLPEPGWLYGHCNFKSDFSASYNLKFADRFDTVVSRNMEIFSRDLGNFTLVVTQRELLQQFKALQIDARFGAKLVLSS